MHRRPVAVLTVFACRGIYPCVVFLPLAFPFTVEEIGNRDSFVALVLEIWHAVKSGLKRIAFVPAFIGHAYPAAAVPSVPVQTVLIKLVVAPLAYMLRRLLFGKTGIGEPVLHGIEKRRVAGVVEIGAEHHAYAL